MNDDEADDIFEKLLDEFINDGNVSSKDNHELKINILKKRRALESHEWEFIHDFNYVDDFSKELDRVDYYFRCKKCGTWGVSKDGPKHPDKVDSDNNYLCKEILVKDVIE